MDNETLLWIAGLLLAIPVGLVLLISAILYGMMIKLSDPQSVIRRLPNIATHPRLRQAVDRHRAWADEHGLDWVEAYDCGQIAMGLWKHLSEPIFFCVYVGPTDKLLYDIVTVLDAKHHIGVTTHNSPDGMMLPAAPGSYRQSFPDLPLEELWERHLAAEVFLSQELRIQPRPLQQHPYDLLCDSMRRQVNHVRRIPLWPLRGAYWYFIARHRRVNQSVEEQFATGSAGAPSARGAI